MPMVWNDQADAKLLMAIIVKNDAKMNWDGIAEYMGSECTVRAVQHRIQRLKEKAKASNLAPATNGGENKKEDGASSAAPSPEKRKRGRPKKAVPVDENANPAYSGEEGGRPTKMQKISKAEPMGMGPGQHEIKVECSEEFA